MTKNSNEQQVDRMRGKLEMKSLGIVQKVEGTENASVRLFHLIALGT